MPSLTPRLITIPFSHYCEKARWALDHTRQEYLEQARLPGLHIVPTRRAGGKTVPVLVTERATLTDSADIVSWCDAHAADDRRLYPRDPALRREVEEIETLCNGELGRASRLFVYHHALPVPRVLVASVRPGLNALEAFVLPFLLPALGKPIRRAYRIDETSAARAADRLRRGFELLSARLTTRRFLVGDAFTAADLTFAALTAPVIQPPCHPAMASEISHVSGPLRDLTEELRATPAGRHAEALYREHRHTKNA